MKTGTTPAEATPPPYPEGELVDAATERLIAHMAHELRTPLSSALLWAKILTTPGHPPDAERLQEGLAAIEGSIQEQQTVIDGLVDVAEILSGRVQLDLKEIDPQPALKRAVEAVRPIAAENDLELEFNFPDDVIFIRADDRRLQQAVGNLLENAIKFTPRRGRVVVTLGSHDTDVEIRVMDTGQGVSAELLPKIFDRFLPANPSVGRAQRGYGLGLLLTRHLITRMGGSITAESAGPGQGASFVIRLPAVADGS